MPDIPLDDAVSERAALKLREADLTKHLIDSATTDKDKEKALATAVQKYQFKPTPRPQDIDEKLMKPEPGELVSAHDYELNQAVAFLKTRNTTATAKVN